MPNQLELAIAEFEDTRNKSADSFFTLYSNKLIRTAIEEFVYDKAYKTGYTIASSIAIEALTDAKGFAELILSYGESDTEVSNYEFRQDSLLAISRITSALLLLE